MSYRALRDFIEETFHQEMVTIFILTLYSKLTSFDTFEILCI